MALQRDSDVHVRRKGRNFGTLAVLIGFIAVVFAITVVKVRTGGLLEAFDHTPRASVLPQTEASQ